MVRRRRNRGPEVFTKFDGEGNATDREELGRAERHPGAGIDHLGHSLAESRTAAEPPGLVELVIGWDVYLRNDAEHLAVAKDYGAVVEPVVKEDGSADNHGDVFARSIGTQVENGVFGRGDEFGLGKQVAAGVARHRKLGEHQQGHVIGLGPVDDSLDLLDIKGNVGDLHTW